MDVIREGTFEWSIDSFLQRKGALKKSRTFKFFRESCYLQVPERDGSCYICSLYYPIYLMGIDDGTFSEETIFKLCLIDAYGEESFVTKRTAFSIHSNQLLLMSIHDGELRENTGFLLPGGALTVRLSWHEEPVVVSCNCNFNLQIGNSLQLNDSRAHVDMCQHSTQVTPDLISDKGPEMLLETLSKDFSYFYESKANTDCILKVDGAQFPVHRTVLSARSKVFAAMFSHDTSETRSGVVDIPDVEADVLGDFLHYLYSGKVHGLTVNTAVPLYVVADKYAMIELKNFCIEFLRSTLTIGNVCNAAILAHNHEEEELEKEVVQFIQDRMEEVQDSVEWKMLSSSKPSLVIKLLSYTVMACKDKMKEMSEK